MKTVTVEESLWQEIKDRVEQMRLACTGERELCDVQNDTEALAKLTLECEGTLKLFYADGIYRVPVPSDGWNSAYATQSAAPPLAQSGKKPEDRTSEYLELQEAAVQEWDRQNPGTAYDGLYRPIDQLRAHDRSGFICGFLYGIRYAAPSLAQSGTGAGQHLYIDCEFNGGKGELISMALVADDGREFYEVVPRPASIDPWVQEHVIPILHKEPVTMPEFYNRLFAFLDQFKEPTIVADHPADIAYFADALITDRSGTSYKCDWRALRRNVNYDSAEPHNALADARALKVLLATPPPSAEPSPAVRTICAGLAGIEADGLVARNPAPDAAAQVSVYGIGKCEFCSEPACMQMMVDPFGKSDKWVGLCAKHSGIYVTLTGTAEPRAGDEAIAAAFRAEWIKVHGNFDRGGGTQDWTWFKSGWTAARQSGAKL